MNHAHIGGGSLLYQVELVQLIQRFILRDAVQANLFIGDISLLPKRLVLSALSQRHNKSLNTGLAIHSRSLFNTGYSQPVKQTLAFLEALMAKPIAFGEFQFRTKSAAKEEIRKRINSYETGQELSLDDQIFFSELFKLHSEYDQKIGSGIKTITIERDFHNNRCLYIHRTDSTKTDISWVHCVQPATTKTVISMAFRRSVKESIINYKLNTLATRANCPVLDIPLDFKNSHVVYVGHTFDELLTTFLNVHNLNLNDIELKNPTPDDLDQRGILKDITLTAEWRNYHSTNSKLDLWSAKANLSKKS